MPEKKSTSANSTATADQRPDPTLGRASYQAQQAPDAVIIFAFGWHPTPGYTDFFEQSPIDIFPPQFIFRSIPPGGMVPQVLTPFAIWVAFGATEPIKTVTVHDADGAHEIPVEQMPKTLAAAAKAQGTWVSGSVVRGGAAAVFNRPTTMATGEEGGGPTTMATGEEMAAAMPSTWGIGEEDFRAAMAPTTMATGEEGGGPTTMATGEETAQMATMTTLALGEEDPPMTTLALGEEGTTLRIGEEGPTPTTLALGEETTTTSLTATTLAVGEEGPTTRAVGEENPTTLALGEENPPTTDALGEEGPIPTTLALGEETTTTGLTATTLAVGEEDPTPTTLALGEEGPTTRAVGEENPTTLALGEENPTTDALGEEGPTTMALGEETTVAMRSSPFGTF